MTDIRDELGLIVEMKGVGKTIDTLRSAIDGGILVLRISSALEEPLMDPEKVALGLTKMVDALSDLALAASAKTIAVAIEEGDMSHETLVTRVEEVRTIYMQKISDALTGGKKKANVSGS